METRGRWLWALGAVIALCAIGAAVMLVIRHTKPTPEQLKAFRSVKTVRVKVNEAYYCNGCQEVVPHDRHEIEGVSLCFWDIAVKGLEVVGLQVVPSDTHRSDAVLTVNARGDTEYRVVPGAWCNSYAHASISGEIIFEVPGISPYKKRFKSIGSNLIHYAGSGDVGVPVTSNPADAPWEQAFGEGQSSFPSRLRMLI